MNPSLWISNDGEWYILQQSSISSSNSSNSSSSHNYALCPEWFPYELTMNLYNNNTEYGMSRYYIDSNHSRTNAAKTRAFADAHSSPITKVENFKEGDTTITSWSDEVEKRESKYLKALNTLNRVTHSSIFVWVGTLLVISFHILIWMSVGLIDDQYYSNNRFLTTNSSIFNSKGCYSSGPSGIVIISFIAFYLAIDLVVIVILFFATKKDTYRIKPELIILFFSRLFLSVLYFISTQVQLFRILSRIIPSNHTILAYAFVEIIVSVLLPIFRDLKSPEKSEVLESEIESVLNNKETFKIILDFATRSFCAESILFYKDVQHYKKLIVKYQVYEINSVFHNAEMIKKHRHNIHKLVTNIMNSYFMEGSINELNLPNGKLLRNDINAKLKELETTHGSFPIDLFDSSLVESLLTILGLYERLKYSNKLIEEYSNEYKRNIISQL